MSVGAEPVAILEQPGFPLLKKHLIAWTGLAYYETRDRDLAAIIAQRLSELRMEDCALYLALLSGPDARSAAEKSTLIARLTVGETYFFRDHDQFEALRGTVLPAIIARNQHERKLRIWSAGCSTGAEPYSIAILIARAFGVETADWQIRILGTDINVQFVAQAREGCFTEWHFRATSDSIRQQCFRAKGSRWEISPTYRKWVSFETHNLVVDPFPPGPFDLILCRNVAIYFSHETTKSVMHRLANSLTAGGWLMTGCAELAGERFESLELVEAHRSVLYRKREPPTVLGAKDLASAAQLPCPAEAGSPGATRVSSSPEYSHGIPDPGTGARPELAPACPLREIQQMRQLADSGHWEQAARQGRALVENHPLNPLVYLYYALVLEHLNELGAAEGLLRKAIYLDRHFVLAHYHLGIVLGRDPQQAAHTFENARLLLAGMPDSHAFPEADGITVAELKEAIRIQLEALLVR